DAYVDSTVVKSLQVADRRLSAGSATYPINLDVVDDLTTLRKAFLKSMASIGQAPGAKGGGNQRKAVRLVLDGLPALSPEQLADVIAGITPLADAASGMSS
ncbi:MAG: hypothetical protein RL219_1052, partial [Actinomycetota bacterium]